MTRRLVVLAICLAWAHTWPARAVDPQPDRRPAPLWLEVSDPDAQRASLRVEQARRELVLASAQFPMGWETACKRLSAWGAPLDLPGFTAKRTRILSSVLSDSMQRLTHIENAIARLREAAQLAPRDPDVLYLLGVALREWERPLQLDRCRTQHRDAEAIELLERLRVTHPGYRPAAVAFDLAILYTRTLQFDRAVSCYAYGAPLEMNVGQLGVLYSNWAEVTMLAGDPMHAVRLYERAIAASSGGRDFLLPAWGMAVALDRLGEHESAIEKARAALQAEAGSMAVLHSDGVFFEPESEIHYYEGLGHEARVGMPGVDTLNALEQAASAWRTFFATGGDQTPWATSARDNLRVIEQRIAEVTATQASDAAPGATKRPARSTRRR